MPDFPGLFPDSSLFPVLFSSDSVFWCGQSKSISIDVLGLMGKAAKIATDIPWWVAATQPCFMRVGCSMPKIWANWATWAHIPGSSNMVLTFISDQGHYFLKPGFCGCIESNFSDITSLLNKLQAFTWIRSADNCSLKSPRSRCHN